MFHLHIEPVEIWDEVKEEFLYVGPKEGKDIFMEHSLYSMARWESKYHKPYLNTEKTAAEAFDYFSMMVIGSGEVSPDTFRALTDDQVKALGDYINDPMTATTFSDAEKKFHGGSKKIKGEIITAELIYYYMTVSNIPFECERWHLNRLITLIRVCAIKNDPDAHKKKRISTAELQARKAEMEARRAKYHTNG